MHSTEASDLALLHVSAGAVPESGAEAALGLGGSSPPRSQKIMEPPSSSLIIFGSATGPSVALWSSPMRLIYRGEMLSLLGYFGVDSGSLLTTPASSYGKINFNFKSELGMSLACSHFSNREIGAQGMAWDWQRGT